MSDYFASSNVIDIHNQGRRYELKLEKYWIVRNPFFRLATTLVGMTVTDAWKAYRFAISTDQLHPDKNLTMKDFTDRLAYDCLRNEFSKFDGSCRYDETR